MEENNGLHRAARKAADWWRGAVGAVGARLEGWGVPRIAWDRRAKIVVACVAGLLVVFLAMRSCGGGGATGEWNILTAKADRRDFSVVVETVGELDAARSTLVSSTIRGDKGKILWLAADGVKVKKGDPLIRLDRSHFEQEVERLEAQSEEDKTALDAEKQNLEFEKIQVERQLKTAEFEKETAELDLMTLEKGDGPLEMARLEGGMLEAKLAYDEKQSYIKELEQLTKDGYANATEVWLAKKRAEEAERAYDVALRQFESYRDYALPARVKKAKARVAKTTMELEQTKKGKVYQIGQAMTRLSQAEKDVEASALALGQARAELDRTTIAAPISGMVVLYETYRGGQNRKPRVGDKVLQNQPLIYLPDISSMIVKTRVREVDLHKLDVGKPALVFVDAYPALKLRGEVTNIGVLAKADVGKQRGDKYFGVRVKVTDRDLRLRPGMTARVQIHCAQLSDALSVPLQALFREGEEQYCFVPSGSRYEKREVAAGEQSESWVRILDGLKKGERVALSRPSPKDVRKTRMLKKPKRAKKDSP